MAETPIANEIAHLRDLDLQGLRARWQSVFQRPAPAHLGRHLLFSIIAYQIQADRFGDLDHETKKLLDRTEAVETGSAMPARLVAFDQKRRALTKIETPKERPRAQVISLIDALRQSAAAERGGARSHPRRGATHHQQTPARRSNSRARKAS